MMTSFCNVCDLPVKASNMQLHMNRQHKNLSSTTINAAEVHQRTLTDTYSANRWVECISCYTISGTHRHFLGIRGLRIHEATQHSQLTPISTQTDYRDPPSNNTSPPPLPPPNSTTTTQSTARANTLESSTTLHHHHHHHHFYPYQSSHPTNHFRHR